MSTEKATRPVRIYLASREDKALMGSLTRVFSTLLGDKMILVEIVGESDVVVAGDQKEIEKGYDSDKSYILLDCGNTEHSELPGNCTAFKVPFLLPDLLKKVLEIREQLAPIAETPERREVPLRSDALRILVIDDSSKNIDRAQRGLAVHRLTTATGYKEAMDILGSETFDVVLTDLHLPMSSEMLSQEAFKFGQLVPYGILLMIKAAQRGAKRVAVVIDLSHHSDPFSAAFDHFSRLPVKIDGAKVMMMHAHLLADGSKDWASALATLLGE